MRTREQEKERLKLLKECSDAYQKIRDQATEIKRLKKQLKLLIEK